MTLNDNAPAITAREVYQLLKDVALGTRTLRSNGSTNGNGHVAVAIDGWQLTLFIEGDVLRHCEHCISPEGRSATVETWQRYGTDPVALLSGWEHQQWVQLIKPLR
ncbi:DUF7693 family protein [Rhodococcus sp. IEGM1300]